MSAELFRSFQHANLVETSQTMSGDLEAVSFLRVCFHQRPPVLHLEFRKHAAAQLTRSG